LYGEEEKCILVFDL